MSDNSPAVGINWCERLGAAAAFIWAVHQSGEQNTSDRRSLRFFRERLIAAARQLDELQADTVIGDDVRPSDLSRQQVAALIAWLERRDESTLLYGTFTARQIGRELDAALARLAEQAKP